MGACSVSGKNIFEIKLHVMPRVPVRLFFFNYSNVDAYVHLKIYFNVIRLKIDKCSEPHSDFEYLIYLLLY